MNKSWLSMSLFSLISIFASVAEAGGLGGVADNLVVPISLFSDFVATASLFLGGAFLFASIIKYFEHRRSPTMVPISTVIFLIIAGIIFILLPFAYLITDNGIPYSLFRR